MRKVFGDFKIELISKHNLWTQKIGDFEFKNATESKKKRAKFYDFVRF